ncbi:rhodanese-related sulfurtransferase [Oculatella sp. FACHB-28]|uniref:rhodanese-like domain-containing protein n=1 Tax=Oculatella sp. FACHB-28 TaxID=2692845 RepID=UPI00168244EE|nr:rhodanese-like domain-containing protein [Oculatella sp. FACHB-28]MBD2058578.1 rhodanese-related sulfurtransferase [Oculatella sp. FACHB-28]
MTAQASNLPLAHISVEELAERLAAGDHLQLIDVREPEELTIASLDPFHSLPLSQFAQWSGQVQTQFDPHAETVVMCHHGVRSAQMCHWLLNQGFTHVKNLTGGIDAYSTAVDPTVPRY